MIRTTTIPPEILQCFDSKLLSYPVPKFRDDSERLDHVYQIVVRKLSKITPSEKIKRKQREYLELYERIKTKEKELEGKTNHNTQRSFYYFGRSNRKGQDVFERLRFRKRIRRNN